MGQEKQTKISNMYVYHNGIGGFVVELQWLEFCVSIMRNHVKCYFVFNNQSHYSGVCVQRVKEIKFCINVMNSAG